MHVKVNYPEDPKILDQLETRAAKALATLYSNILPPEKLDELIDKLKKALDS